MFDMKNMVFLESSGRRGGAMPPNCPSTAPPSAAKEEFRGRLHQSLARMLAKAPVGHWHH